MRRLEDRTPARRRGQVTVEMALAASGIVVLAFMGAKVAAWLNESLVQRNDQFQAGRTVAGQPGAGLVPVGAVAPITLIGGGGSSPGGAGPQPPSSYNWVCPQGFAFISHAAQDRSDAHNLMTFATTANQNAVTEANKVKDLLDTAKNLRVQAYLLRVAAANLRAVAAQLRADAAALRSGVPALRAEAADLLAQAATWRTQAQNLRILAFIAAAGGNQALADLYLAYATALDNAATDNETQAAALTASADNAELWATTLESIAAADEMQAAADDITATNDETFAAALEAAARQANATALGVAQALQNTVVPTLHQRLLHAEEDERQSIVQCGRR